MHLTDRQERVLEIVCDALIPSVARDGEDDAFWRRNASDLAVAEHVSDAISRLTPAEQKQFRRLLDLLASPLLGVTWGGPPRPIDRLEPPQREQLLQRWCRSPVPNLRNAFQTLKKLSLFYYYAESNGTPNPNWMDIGYPGPASAPPEAAKRPITPLRVTPDSELRCRTVIIGSGAGGGVVAGELAAAGDDIIILEKGPYFAEPDFNQREAEMIRGLYEAGGALASTNGGITVLAGSCLGGGTTINWTASFRLPAEVAERWAREHDNPHLLGNGLTSSFEAVERLFNVTRGESPHNPQNQALWNGASRLGYQVEVIPRNVNGCAVDECRECGYCCFGCQRGSKISTLKSPLAAAAKQGARFLVNTEADRIICKGNRATAVVAHQRNGDSVQQVTIRADRVIVAAGALHTPAVLLRSGIEHPEIGRNLYLHPTSAAAARYPSPINPWWGTMMSAVCDEFTRLDGTFGVKLETPPAHSGLLAMALPWVTGEQHKRDMLSAASIASIIALTRDRYGGRILLDRHRRMRVSYQLHPYDRKHLLRGIAESFRIHRAAGADELYVLHNAFPKFDCGRSDTAFETFLSGLDSLNWGVNRFALFSAHQMGTCRMGGKARTHPVAPSGRLHGMENVYVADASVFPESSGANPMLTIEALAHMIAQGLK